MKRLSIWLTLLVAAGCASATVPTTQPAEPGLPEPDRVIVHDLAVVAAGEERGDDAAAARVITDYLIKFLREHGVNAVHVSATPLPGSTTASIRGEITHRAGSGEIRSLIQVYQGAGGTSRLVAEIDARAPKLGTGGQLPARTAEVDARRTAETVADRIGYYYRDQGWPWR